MNIDWLQVIAAGICSVGFSIIFRIRVKYFPVSFIGGALCWLLFLTASSIWEGRTTTMIITAICVTAYAEIAARIVKLPVPVIYSPSIIPLIPGGNLYYCLRGFVTNSRTDFSHYGMLLLEDTLGIVLGSVIVLSFVSAITAKKRGD